MTAATRIVPLDPATMAPLAQAAGMNEFMASRNVFRVLMRHPRLGEAVRGLLLSMLSRSAALDPRLRELVILRVSWKASSAYVWSGHCDIAGGLGVSAEDIAAVRAPGADAFDGVERHVIAVADAVATGQPVDDQMWDELLAAFGGDLAPVMEVVAVAEIWRLMSGLTRTFAVPLDDGQQAWPPDGFGPGAGDV